jgi:23S rRNA (cytidine1920-2'-O)/16S rRNA (cytidine1409-2'-O)-methyltransferase
VDSGNGQLCDAVRNDKRVASIENYNARFMKAEDLEYIPTLAVMDVSFISSTLIIPSVFSVLSDGGIFVLLVKPQFEVGRGGIGKGGIVKSEALRERALSDVITFACGCGFKLVGTMLSPIEGGDGNVEYLACFRKEL